MTLAHGLVNLAIKFFKYLACLDLETQFPTYFIMDIDATK